MTSNINLNDSQSSVSRKDCPNPNVQIVYPKHLLVPAAQTTFHPIELVLVHHPVQEVTKAKTAISTHRLSAGLSTTPLPTKPILKLFAKDSLQAVQLVLAPPITVSTRHQAKQETTNHRKHTLHTPLTHVCEESRQSAPQPDQTIQTPTRKTLVIERLNTQIKCNNDQENGRYKNNNKKQQNQQSILTSQGKNNKL